MKNQLPVFLTYIFHCVLSTSFFFVATLKSLFFSIPPSTPLIFNLIQINSEDRKIKHSSNVCVCVCIIIFILSSRAVGKWCFYLSVMSTVEEARLFVRNIYILHDIIQTSRIHYTCFWMQHERPYRRHGRVGLV